MSTKAESCGCSCCAEAINRAQHDRNPFAGCNCNDYPENLRCDCPFCTIILGWRPGDQAICN